MDKEKKLTQTFFDESASKYSKFAFSKWSKDVREKTKAIIDREIYGRVVDIGGGGELHYRIDKSDIFISFDISYQQLKKMPSIPRVYPVCGDAEMLPFRGESLEVVICRSFLHHLVGNNIEQSNTILRKILLEILAILGQQKKIIIMENCLPLFLEKIQNLLFVFFRIVFGLLKKPLVRLLSISTLESLLREAGFVETVVTKIKEKRNWRMVPIGVIFPFLKVPHCLVPTSDCVIISRKQ